MLYVGEAVHLDYSVTDGATFVEPATITLTVTQPDGTAVTVNPANPAVGRYQADYVPAEPGRYQYRWVTTGPASASQDVFNVVEAAPIALCSLGEFKQHLNMTGSEDDDELRRHLASATRVIERHRDEVVAARQFRQRVDVDLSTQLADRYPYSRRVEAAFTRRHVLLDRHPVIAVTAITDLDGNDVGVDGWTLNSVTGLLSSNVTQLNRTVDITYVAGYRVVPENFILAAQIIAAHTWETQRGSTLTAGPQYGTETQFLAPTGQGYAIPNRAVELLGGRPPVVA